MITTHNTLITSTGMTPSVIMNEGSVQQLAYCYLVTFTYIYEGRTESHEKLFFLHANWEQQTKESAVVDGTSCCVILECIVTSIACIT